MNFVTDNISLSSLPAYPNQCLPKRCNLLLLMSIVKIGCISLKKILDISELELENEQHFILHVCSCYFVTCVLKIEKQRRIERIKQKRAQLQELLLQVKMLGCFSLSSLPGFCFFAYLLLKSVCSTLGTFE